MTAGIERISDGRGDIAASGRMIGALVRGCLVAVAIPLGALVIVEWSELGVLLAVGAVVVTPIAALAALPFAAPVALAANLGLIRTDAPGWLGLCGAAAALAYVGAGHLAFLSGGDLTLFNTLVYPGEMAAQTLSAACWAKGSGWWVPCLAMLLTLPAGGFTGGVIMARTLNPPPPSIWR